MKKWIVKSTLDKREHYKSKVIEADTEEQAYEYYIENVWGTDKDVVVNKCYLDDSDDTLKVEQMKKGSA